MKRAIVVLSVLSGFAFVIGQSISFIITRTSASAAISRSASRQSALLSDHISLRAGGRGNPYISLGDGRDLETTFITASGVEASLEASTFEPAALASADFDDDGVADLVSVQRKGISTIPARNYSLHYHGQEYQEQ